VPAGVPGLVVARLFLGAGEGLVFTAGAAWTVDLSSEDTRGRAIGLFGLTIWSALTAGPLIGEGLRTSLGYDAVWAFAAAAPVCAAAWEAAGLAILGFAGSLPVAVIGAVVMGFGFSVLFPSLALIVVNAAGDTRRGAALGTFTAFFDLGMGVGGLVAGTIAAL